MKDEWDWFESLPGDAQEEINALRAIVQDVAERDPGVSYSHGLTIECEYCGVRAHTTDAGTLAIDHTHNCTWLKARQLSNMSATL